MTTDPGLPGVLRTAASRVDRVGEQLAALDVRLAMAGMSVAWGWHGVASVRFSKVLLNLQTEAGDSVRAASSLAGVLRRAAGTADERIRQDQAAAARARAQAEAARRAAAQQSGGSR